MSQSHSQRTVSFADPAREEVSVKTSKLIAAEVRRAVATAYKGEVDDMLKWRHIWKKSGDVCEAVAKGLTGVSTILAFAASSNRDSETTDILAFVSGCVGTAGLVLLTYSAYASRESKQRTSELNHVLHKLGVTPMPDISTAGAGDAV